MKPEEVVAKLRPLEPELRLGGISALYLFGSTARGEAREDSDVDLLYDIDDSKRLGFFEFYALEERVAAHLDCNVDLVSRKYLRARVRKFAEPEMIKIF